MTEEQINELLADILSMYAPEFGRAITRKAAWKLAVSHVEDQIKDAGEHAYALAEPRFQNAGPFLRKSPEMI